MLCTDPSKTRFISHTYLTDWFIVTKIECVNWAVRTVSLNIKYVHLSREIFGLNRAARSPLPYEILVFYQLSYSTCAVPPPSPHEIIGDLSRDVQ